MSSEWIAIGTPRGGSVALEISDESGPAFYWSPSYVAAMLGQRFVTHWQVAEPIDLRGCRKRWIGADGNSVDADALEGVTLVSASGVRVPLAEAIRLLGFESPESFVDVLAVSATRAPAKTAAAPLDEYYSSRKGAAHLPGKSRRWMLEKARQIPGASKVGRDWIVPRAAYAQWLTEQDVALCRGKVAPTPAVGLDAHTIAEQTLANAGLRPTRVP